MKKQDLKEHKKEVEEELKKKSLFDFDQREDDKDNTGAKEYRDQFLREFDAILLDLNELPDQYQSKYRLQLANLLDRYQKKVNALLEKGEGGLSFGEAVDPNQIFLEMIPEVNDIRSKIKEEVDYIKERERFNNEVEDLKRNLTSGYTDGWTDGYTDDLTSGGVAYQTKERH